MNSNQCPNELHCMPVNDKMCMYIGIHWVSLAECDGCLRSITDKQLHQFKDTCISQNIYLIIHIEKQMFNNLY